MAARNKLSELGRGLNSNTPESVQVGKTSKGISFPRFCSGSPGSSGRKAKRKGWTSLKELTASTTDKSPAGSGAQRPASKPFHKMLESPIRAMALDSKHRFQAALSTEGRSLEKKSISRLHLEQMSAMSDAVQTGPTVNGHLEDTLLECGINSGKEERVIGLSECHDHKERLANQDTAEILNTDTLTSQESGSRTFVNGHASNSTWQEAVHSLSADVSDGLADTANASLIPQEKIINKIVAEKSSVVDIQKFNVDATDNACVASMGQSQGLDEVANITANETSSSEAEVVEVAKSNAVINVQPLCNNNACKLSACPISLVDIHERLVVPGRATVKESHESEVKVISRFQCNSALALSGNNHSNGSKKVVGGPFEQSQSNVVSETDACSSSENRKLGSHTPGLSSGLQASFPSDLTTIWVEDKSTIVTVGAVQEGGKTFLLNETLLPEQGMHSSFFLEHEKGTTVPDCSIVKLSEAGVQCSLPLYTESVKDAVMHSGDSLLKMGMVDPNKKLSDAGSKGFLPFEQEAFQLLNQALHKVNDVLTADTKHYNSFHKSKTMRRHRHVNQLRSKNYHFLKQQLLIISSLKNEIYRLSGQMLDLKMVIEQLTKRLSEVSTIGVCGESGLYVDTKVKANRVYEAEDAKVTTLGKEDDGFCYIEDSDGLQRSTDEEARFSSAKKMRYEDLEDLGDFGTNVLHAVGWTSEQVNKCESELNGLLAHGQRERETGINMAIQVTSLDGKINPIKDSRVEILPFTRGNRPAGRKIPVFRRFGHQWFAICKSHKKFKWRII